MTKNKKTGSLGTRLPIQYNFYLYMYLCIADSRDEYNRSPVHYACISGHLNLVEYLVNANCDVSE